MEISVTPIKGLEHVQNVIGRKEGVHLLAAMNLLMLPSRNLFVCDTYVNADPSADEIAAMTLLAAEQLKCAVLDWNRKWP